MNDTQAAIEVLRLQLARLEITTDNIREALDQLEAQNHRNTSVQNETAPTDRDGTSIVIEARVVFLTSGCYRSTHGTVTRISRNNERIFLVDNNGVEIAQAPRNLRVSVIQNDQ